MTKVYLLSTTVSIIVNWSLYKVVALYSGFHISFRFETLNLRKQVMENCFNISLRGMKYVASSSAVSNFMETLSKRDHTVVNNNGDYFVDRNTETTIQRAHFVTSWRPLRQ